MIRGTTPTHTFNIPLDSSQIAAVRVIYTQRGKEILRKGTKDFTMDGNTIRVELKQEDTLLFDCDYSVKLQLRVLTSDGKILATKPIIVNVEECLDNEVLQ